VTAVNIKMRETQQ